MLKYQEIFTKYGIEPPRTIHIPTKEEILNNIENFDSEYFDVPDDNPHLVCVFYLAFAQHNKFFKVADHKLFMKNFDLKFDLSKFHSDLFYKFPFYVTRDGRFNIFGLEADNFVTDLIKKQEEQYFIHYDIGYPLKKVFSDNAEENMKYEYIGYIESSFDNAFDNMDGTPFYKELYEWVTQEQKKSSVAHFVQKQ